MQLQHLQKLGTNDKLVIFNSYVIGIEAVGDYEFLRGIQNEVNVKDSC